jgi:hypothetical protein
MKDRKHHFYEGAGNPILGYNTNEGVVCRDCAKDNPELASIDPRTVNPIHLDNLGDEYRDGVNFYGHDVRIANPYPDGFTCTGCGDVLGAWDYKGED